MFHSPILHYNHPLNMDIWNKDKRSAVMAKIGSKDTKPELIVRRYLYSRGYRYRKNVKGLPGTPDIVLKKYGVVIFVHGCFWHGHELDGHLPKSNKDFWRNKIERNKTRDNINKEKLRNMGWSVITVWECQLKPAIRQRTLAEIEYCINTSFLNRYRNTATKNTDYDITTDDSLPLAAEPHEDYGNDS